MLFLSRLNLFELPPPKAGISTLDEGNTTRTYQAFEVLHEDLQTNIIGEDSLPSTSARSRAIHTR